MSPRCPTCRAEVKREAPTFPFCCEHCRMADLGGWLNERYRVAAMDEEDDASSEPAKESE